MKCYGLLALILLVSSLGAREGFSQNWSTVTLDTPANRTPYFLDPNIGFAYTSGLEAQTGLELTYFTPHLERTTDGGATWQYLPFFDSIGCSITGISFVSLEHGYVATNYGWNFVNQGIYETNDQGAHWQKISPEGLAFTGVYAEGNSIFASEATTSDIANSSYFGMTGQILFSRNDGASWDSISTVAGLSYNSAPQFQLIYGNRDSLVATVYFDDSSYKNGENTYLVYSTDLGRSWESTFLDSNYKFPFVSLFVQPHSCNILRLHIDSTNYLYGTTTFLESNLPYSSWNTSLTGFPTDYWLGGTSCDRYISEGSKTYRGEVSPLRRTNTNGTPWIALDSMSGLDDIFDFDDDIRWPNISVVGYGSVAFVANDYRQMMQTTDGGDGTLSIAQLAPRIECGNSFASSSDTITMSECSPTSFYFYYQNLACAVTTLQSITISGLDPSEYSYTVSDHSNCSDLPDTAFVSLNPHPTGTYSLIANARFVDDEFHTIDTTITFTLVVTPGIQPTVLSLKVNSTHISAAPGDTIEIPVYFSGNAALSSTQIQLPFTIDTAILRPVPFRSSAPSIVVDSAYYSNGVELIPMHTAGVSLSGQTQLGTFRCLCYLTDSLSTTVAFASPNLSSPNTPCLAVSPEFDTVSISIAACGDSTLLFFMRTDSIPIVIQSIVPNPASGTMSIALDQPRSEAISYWVMDAMGKTCMQGTTVSDALDLDVSSLASGIYFFRAENYSGLHATKQFVVVR